MIFIWQNSVGDNQYWSFSAKLVINDQSGHGNIFREVKISNFIFHRHNQDFTINMVLYDQLRFTFMFLAFSYSFKTVVS